MPKSKNEKTKNILGPLLNKNLGQHILSNPLVAQSIVEKANLRDSDIVLEIGPGTGNLTMKMLEKCKKVIAIEMDPRMAAELVKRAERYKSKLEIIIGDFLKVTLPFFDVCVSNTPYQISAPLVHKLLQSQFRCAVLMFQREFAMRLVAKSGDALYSRLSVNTQLFAKVDHLMKVSRNSFRPPPQVDSSVVRLEPFYPRPTLSFLEWDGLLRICFGRKNKTIRSNFFVRNVLNMCLENLQTFCSIQNTTFDQDIKILIQSILDETELGDSRAVKLDLQDFMKLLLAFNNKGIHFTYFIDSYIPFVVSSKSSA